MPMYDFSCDYCDKIHTESLSFSEFDGKQFPVCCRGHRMSVRLNVPALYGMMRCRDSAFSDATEATGEAVSSTKDIDRLEKAGVIRAVTNPSRHRTYKDKK